MNLSGVPKIRVDPHRWPGWRSPVWTAVLLVAVLFLLALHLWGLRLFGRGSVDYQRFGDIGTWVQGVGTIAAVVVALRQIRRQEATWYADKTLRDIQERSQVYCWLIYRDGDGSPAGWYLNFNNLTPLPIAAWSLTVKEASTGREIGKLDVSTFDQIPPGFSRVRTRIPPGEIDQPLCDLDFVDQAGQCWRRSSLGPLTRLDSVTVNGQLIGGSPALPSEPARQP